MTERLDYTPTCGDCHARLTRDDVLRADELCADCFNQRREAAFNRAAQVPEKHVSLPTDVRGMYEE